MNHTSGTLSACGVSHKTCSLEERERFQLTSEAVPEANAVLARLPRVLECVVLNTCNRVEFYLVTEPGSDPFAIVSAFYREFRGLDVAPHRGVFRVRSASHAADHLFRVAAGIDSMVLGENQILGQVKNAYSDACAVKSAGKVIHRLFHQAIRIGKKVRTDTEIGKGACSVISAALEMLGDRLDAIANPTVLLIGVNKMIRIAATRFRRIEGGRLLFANRTSEKVEAFAAGFDAVGYGLEKLPDLIALADVVVSCTSAPHPILTREIMADVVARRSPRARVIMDLAIPRDVEISDGWSPTVEVFDLEDVRRFVKDRQHERELEIPHAEALIRRRLNDFLGWYDQVTDQPGLRGEMPRSTVPSGAASEFV
jgi:glutamyl-tRNA reductase